MRYTGHLKVGRIVYDKQDPRHLGEVVAILNSSVCVVRWLDTCWKSEIPLRRIRVPGEGYPLDVS